jgi:hypothetical protein
MRETNFLLLQNVQARGAVPASYSIAIRVISQGQNGRGVIFTSILSTKVKNTSTSAMCFQAVNRDTGTPREELRHVSTNVTVCNRTSTLRDCSVKVREGERM